MIRSSTEVDGGVGIVRSGASRTCGSQATPRKRNVRHTSSIPSACSSTPSSRRGAISPRIGIWIAAIPIFVTLATALTIRTEHNGSESLVTTGIPTAAPIPVTPQIAALQPVAREPDLRVNLTPAGAESIRLEIRSRCHVTALESGELFETLPPGVATVSSTSSGLSVGSRVFETNSLEIVPEESPSIRIDDRLYRGAMRIYRLKDGRVAAINVIPIEAYLASVVDSEMPAAFPEPARQAQAIVARTYALYQAQHTDPRVTYDLVASQRSQKYLGVEYISEDGRRLAGESESSRRVVAATRGVVCQTQGRLFCTYYSAVCGGQTTNGRQVFKDADDILKAAPCEWCRESPRYRWTKDLDIKDFQRWAIDSGHRSSPTTIIRSIRQTSDSQPGQIPQFEIDVGQRVYSLNGIELRDRLPAGALLSPHFRINVENGRVIFEGRGHGHGVGFCQWGAKGQAEAGKTSVEILQHYYPGAELVAIGY